MPESGLIVSAAVCVPICYTGVRTKTSAQVYLLLSVILDWVEKIIIHVHHTRTYIYVPIHVHETNK